MKVIGSVVVAVAVAVLALVAFRITLPACAALPVVGQLFPSRCPGAHIVETQQLVALQRERHAVLLAQLDQLRREMLVMANCPVPPVPQAQTPVPEPDPAAINPERWRAQDVGLLEGCWQLDSDYSLTEVGTGEVYTVPEWEMCFDAVGAGHQRFRMSNGVQCRSQVTAKFLDSGKLRIREGGNVPCTRGFVYERKIMCDLDERNHVDCETISVERDGHSSVRFRR